MLYQEGVNMFNKVELSLIAIGLSFYKKNTQLSIEDLREDLNYWQNKKDIEKYEEDIKDDLESIKEREEEIQEITNLIIKVKGLR